MSRIACNDITVRYVRYWAGGDGGKTGNVDDRILPMPSGETADGS